MKFNRRHVKIINKMIHWQMETPSGGGGGGGGGGGRGIKTSPGGAPAAAATASGGGGNISGRSSDCRGGGAHAPSRDSVDDFVRQVKGRIR